MAIHNGESEFGAEGRATEKTSKVVDEDKFSHTRRLTAIHNAHDRVIDVRNGVEERLIQGAISEFHARRYYRSAVESFLIESMPVLRAEGLFNGEDYLNDSPLGEIRISPPAELVEFARANVDRLPPGSGIPSEHVVPVVGLKSVLDLPSPVSHRFAVSVQSGTNDMDIVDRVVSEEIPRDVLDVAVQTCDEALEQAEMGLDIETDDQEAEFEYSDLFPGNGGEEVDG